MFQELRDKKPEDKNRLAIVICCRHLFGLFVIHVDVCVYESVPQSISYHFLESLMNLC